MGFDRLARRDQDAAMQRHPALVAARQLDSREAGRLAAPIGLWLALNRRSEALEWFAKAAPADFGESEHEWHARAAAWAGDWPRLQAAIAAMPTELREQNRWRYWAARAAEGRGDAAAARSGFEAVLPTDNWYAALSAARLGRDFAPTPRPLPFDETRIAALAREPAMLRARELYALDRPEAGSEWRWGFERLDRDSQVQALALPARWGRYLEAIAAAATLGLFDDYAFLYPRPYDREVRMGVELARVPPELIYAVMRQESLYRADARSSAGALGLMQMLPTTAGAAAKRYGRPVPSRSDLLVPGINVPLGAAELRILLDRFGGQVPVALAGYNAGPANARRWLPATPRDIDVWVENIPFNETRSYVQRVSWHSVVFGWQQNGRARDLSAWLGRIQPAESVPTGTAEGR
jgi:soluble lytic murein transglycosylase